MERLFADPEFQEKLATCPKELVEQPKTEAELTHEIFCCRKDISRFIDPTSNAEIAVIAEYTKTDQSKSRVLSRLRIGNHVYDLRLPF